MIGKPYINTTSETSRLSIIVRDIATDRNILPNTPAAATSDDFYTIAQASYDASLIDKGICSSTPTTIAIVPMTKLTQNNNAESDILNIQRNLDTLAISNVNEIINNLTGSLTAAVNSSLDDKSQVDALRAATTKLTAAYNSKATYMTHLSELYSIETNSNFSYDFSPSSTQTGIPGEITTTKITSFENKVDWIETYLNLESATITSGYNIKNLLQIIRNSFARKAYGPNFYAAGVSSSLRVRQLNLSAFNAAAKNYFGDLTTVNDASALNLSDENTDILITADSKAVAYTRAGINFETDSQAIIGDLSNYTQELSLSSATNAGVFSSLLRYEDGGKSVLALDVNIADQAGLQVYETADEFFLGLPLVINKELLPTRKNSFAISAQAIETSISTGLSRLILTPEIDLFTWNTFLSQMKFMLQDSFYTTNSPASIMRFALLMSGLNDTEARKRIFKVMMIRDRLINALDYVTAPEKSSFETKARIELDVEIFRLIKYIIPSYGEPVPALRDAEPGNRAQENSADVDVRSQDDAIIESMKSSLGWTPTGTGGAYYNDDAPVEFVSEDSDTAARDMLDALASGLNDPSPHQWDNFFKAARSVEAGSTNFLKINRISSTASVLTSRVGQTSTLTGLTRDDRAFLFFNKWMSLIGDFPFKIEFNVINRSGVSSGTKRSIQTKAYYSSELYSDLKNALSLTLGNFSTAQFNYYFRYVQPLARGILQDTQSFYEGIDYVYRYIMQTSTLLDDASNLAYSYTPAYGERLSNHYTSNAILNLNRQTKLAFSKNSTYQNFSKDQYKNTIILNGFFRYIQDDPEVSTIEDSFVVVCGIPYGMLDRLGAFNQNKLGYVDVSLTLRPIGGSTTGDIVITKSYPISGYVEHQKLSYDTTSNASYQKVLEATSLYELNPSQTLTVNDQFDETSKKNELQSTALLNYIQLFYGLTFDYNCTRQANLEDITSTNTKEAVDAFKNKIYSYRFDELVESRYISTGVNSLRLAQSNLITKTLGGGIFDKIVAIPIDASILKGAGSGYLVDILINVSSRFFERSAPEVPRSITVPGTNLVSSLQNSINQNVSSVIQSSQKFNVRGSQ